MKLIGVDPSGCEHEWLERSSKVVLRIRVCVDCGTWEVTPFGYAKDLEVTVAVPDEADWDSNDVTTIA